MERACRKELTMSIFKKLRPIKPIDELCPPPVVDVPAVIKTSKIKPTKCAGCFSLYQAEHKHLIFERDIGFIYPRYTIYTMCPICRCHNKVEFEDDTV